MSGSVLMLMSFTSQHKLNNNINLGFHRYNYPKRYCFQTPTHVTIREYDYNGISRQIMLYFTEILLKVALNTINHKPCFYFGPKPRDAWLV